MKLTWKFKSLRLSLASLIILTLLGSLWTYAVHPLRQDRKLVASTPLSLAQAEKALSQHQGFFTENKGQWNESILFVGNTTFGRVIFYKDQIQYQLIQTLEQDDNAQGSYTQNIQLCESNESPSYQYQSHVVTLKFPNAQPVLIKGSFPTGTLYNYFIGNNPDKWGKACQAYREIIYSNIWEGIDLKYYFSAEGLKYDFILSPEANEVQLQVEVEGALLELAPHELSFLTSLNTLKDAQLYAYGATTKKSYPLSFAQNTKQSFTFEGIPPTPRKETIIIDPIIQSTYLGGTSSESARCMKIGNNGKIYVAGLTGSHDLPDSIGSAQPINHGNEEGFIAKISLDLTHIYQVTYLGGTDNDRIFDLVLDINNNVYVAGTTRSNDFPNTANGAQTYNAGNGDGFISYLSADLTQLYQSTYLGGGSNDQIFQIFLYNNLVYVYGNTNSINFPNTSGGYKENYTYFDVFISYLSSNLQNLYQSTYLGGSGMDRSTGSHMIVKDGMVYCAGSTSSLDFPGTIGGVQQTLAGETDGFIAMLSDDLTQLHQSTYLGGTGGNTSTLEDRISSMIFSDNKLYIVGLTNSPDFPGTIGGVQQTLAGETDGFIAMLSDDLTQLHQSTYLGGTDTDQIIDIEITIDGMVYCAGSTSSPDFPGTIGGAQEIYAGEIDGFIAMLSDDLTQLHQSTYLGGTGEDAILDIELTIDGLIYVSGSTSSLDFPGTIGGAQEIYAGGHYDGFIAMFHVMDVDNQICGCILQIIASEGSVPGAQGVPLLIKLQQDCCGSILDLKMDGSLKAFNSGTSQDFINPNAMNGTYSIFEYQYAYPQGTTQCDPPDNQRRWCISLKLKADGVTIEQWEMHPDKDPCCP